MPIPSLTSSLKPRSQIGKVSKIKDAAPAGESPSEVAPNHLAGNTLSSAHAPRIHSIPNHSYTDGAKRRSFLPQRGHTQHGSRTNKLGDAPKEATDVESASFDSVDLSDSSRTTTASQRPSVQGSAPGRLRPRSMYQTSSFRAEQTSDGRLPLRSMRPPDTLSSNASSVLQLAGLTRTQSLRKPDTSMQPAQIPNTRLHTRTQSIATVTATRNDATEIKTRPERPRSLYSEPSVTTQTANKAPADIVSNGIRSSGRLAALKRSATTRTKTMAFEPPTGSATLPDDTVATFSKREHAREEPRKQARPAFSTLQQHFTPRKNGKAPTSTFLHPPAPDVGDSPISPEIVSLQSELLQLHLLHASAAQTSKQWELSAKRSLRAKFDEAASLYQIMRENERQGQEQENVQALREWNSGNSTFALVEHIQVLSGPLHELPSLVDNGGRFKRLVDNFERWTEKVELIWTARGEEASGPGSDLGHVEGLGDIWRAENAALTRKLTTFSRDLDRLTQPDSGSSIASIVGTCKALLCGILDELQTMQSIEYSVVTREQDWVEVRLKAIARGVGEFVEADGNEAWRM